MKKLILAGVFACAQLLDAAAYVTIRSGNVSNTTTGTTPWATGSCGSPVEATGVVPGNGDTVIVCGHTLTVDQAWTIGNSASTAVVAINLSNASSVLTVRANLTLQGNLDFTVNGPDLIIDAVTPDAAIVVTLKSSATVTAPKIMFTSASLSSTKTFQVTGVSWTKPVTFTTDTSGGGNKGNIDINGDSVNLAWTFVKLVDLGNSSTTDALNLARKLTWTDVYISGCSKIENTGNTDADSDFDILRLDFRSSQLAVGNDAMSLTNTTTKSVGVRRLRDSTFYHSTDGPQLLISAKGATVSNIVTWNMPLKPFAATSGTAQTFTTIAGVSDNTARAGGRYIISAQAESNNTYSDLFISRFSPGGADATPHSIQLASTALGLGADAISDVVYDGWGTDDTGDLIVPAGAYTLTRALGINRGGNLGDGLSGTVVNAVYLNITGNNMTNGENVGVIVASESSASATKISSVTNSIFTNTHSGLAQGGTTWTPQTSFTWDYNVFYNMTGTNNFVVDSTGVLGPLHRNRVDRTLTGGTVTSVSTGATQVVGCSGCTFQTNGVAIGDIVFLRSQYAVVVAVNSETEIELGSRLVTGGPFVGISGMVNGDTLVIRAGYWNQGTPNKRYGASGAGLNDLNIDPAYVDSTRTSETYTEMIYGSGLTSQAAATEMCQRMIELNGWSYNGNRVTFNTAYTQEAITNWIKRGYTPRRVSLATAGSGGSYIGFTRPTLMFGVF